MKKDNILLKIKGRIDLINSELVNGFSFDDKNKMVIEDVINENIPIINNFNLNSDINVLEKAIKNIYDIVHGVKEEIDLFDFVNNNKFFDTIALKKMFFKKNLNKKFTNFNIDKYLELLNNPPLSYKNFKGETIYFDLYWVKKILIAINQMIFDEMDLYILNIGKEGSGKSLWSSQQILYLYEFLSEIGLIDYAMDIKRLFFADIMSFLSEHENQGKHDYFRIECLDEGNELNRSNFRDENIQQFKYEMRTERKQLRMILINMQQIGELDTSISLSRINFIFDCNMSGIKKTGTLNKGFIDMYIIPRDDFIFSEKYKKIFSRKDILNRFANMLDKKKDYYIGLPKEFIVKSFKFNDAWGFDKEIYDDHVKSQTKSHRFNRNIKLTTLQAYILLSKFSDFKRFKVFDITKNKKDKKMYDVMYKFFEKLKIFFDDNPDKIIGLENFYNRIYNEK